MVGSLSMEADNYTIINIKDPADGIESSAGGVANGSALTTLADVADVADVVVVNDDHPPPCSGQIVSTIGCDDVSPVVVDRSLSLNQLHVESLPEYERSHRRGLGESSASINQTSLCYGDTAAAAVAASHSTQLLAASSSSSSSSRHKDVDQSSEDSHHVQFRECTEFGDDDDDADADAENRDRVHHHFSDDNFPLDDSCCASSQSSSSSEDGDSDQYAEAQAPDGGYGWVIVFVSFMVNLIADGITFSFGVLFPEFVKYFGEGKSYTAWIGSLFLAIPLLSGPIASYLTDRYGCRRVSIAGGILAAAGFVASAFIDSIELLFVTFGVLAGFGLSLCYVAAIVIVAYYFEKKRSLATGLSVCGSGIGTFIFPPFIDYLITEYGWRGTTLILAGLFLNLCVCGLLMRDLEYTKKKRKKRKLSSNARQNRSRVRTNTASSMDSSSQYSQYHTPIVPSTEEVKRLLQTAAVHDREPFDDTNPDAEPLTKEAKNRLFSSLVSLPTFVRNGEKVPLEVLEGLTTNRHLYAVLLHNYPSLLISSRSISDSGCINEQKKRRNPYSKTITPKYSAQFLPALKASTSDVKPDKDESPTAVSKDTEPPTTNDTSTDGGTSAKKQEKRRSILKKKSESLRRGLAAVSHTNSTWWNNKRYGSEYGSESPRLPTAYLRDLKVHRHSLTYRGAMLNIGRYRLRASSCPDIYRNSMTTIAEGKDEWYTSMVDLWHAIADMMDFSYFTNINFLLFAISNFLLYTWYDVPYVYLPDYAVEQGFSKTDSIYIISVVGILNMLGEIAFGWAGDRPWLRAKFIYAVAVALCGVFVAIIPMASNYWQICLVAGGFGLMVAANYSLTSIILVETISLEKFTNAYGLLLLVQGVANLVGPPLAGWLYEVTGNFNAPFYLAGFFIALSGSLLEVKPLMDVFKSIYTKSRKKSKGIMNCVDASENLKSNKSNNCNNHNTTFVP